jgi:hypothetical protein
VRARRRAAHLNTSCSRSAPYAPALCSSLESENGYDYAGQDPINGYDLDGTCPSCFEKESSDGGETERARAQWRAQSRASRAGASLRSLLRSPGQLEGLKVDTVGRLLDRLASGANWTRQVKAYPQDGALRVKWSNPNQQSGEAIILERSGGMKHGVPQGSWYLRLSVGANRALPTDPAVLRIPLSR